MQKALLIDSSFVIFAAAIILVFITATTYMQLGIAILFYPLLIFFAYKVFKKTIRADTLEKPAAKVLSVGDIKRDHIDISDVDKRVFLKLIGGAGLFVFLFSLFNKRADSLFLKYLPGNFRGANLTGDITPTQNQIQEEYKISEIDSDTISFYGFTNKDGAWYIMRADTDKGSFRYSKGESGFPDNWSNRQNLKYDYFSNVF